MTGAAAAVAVALLVATLGVPVGWIEPVFVATWLSVLANVALAQWPLGRDRRWFVAAGANSGLWAGAVVAVAGIRADLIVALPCILLFAIGIPVVRRNWGIGLKVVASWLAAVAILATMLSMVPTPGYTPDHME